MKVYGAKGLAYNRVFEKKHGLHLRRKKVKKEGKDIKYQLEQGYRLQTLIHYVNSETLKEQHRKQKCNKASGIDNITKEEYSKELDENIEKLLVRMKRFSYRPLPVRRTYIPKANGKLRPLGIPAYEDKLVQGCLADILNEIYENIFLDCSYGFRPNRNCHQAIKEINQTIMTKKINYILDCDIKGFFDNVDHEWLMKFLEHTIQDKNFLRYIKKFLLCGYMENMKYHSTKKGTPQGGLISPILANVYLHYVLDLWFEKIVKPKLRGEAYLVRYADDFIIMFQYENEAKSLYKVLVKRFAKFGLEIEENKTKIVPFGRYKGTKETFDFLGFTHYNCKTRNGKYRVGHRIVAKKRKLKQQAITKWIKENRNTLKFKEIIKSINKILTGLYAYYGINGMIKELYKIYKHTLYALRSSMFRRSQRKLSKIVYYNILKRQPIVKPRIYQNIWS